MKEIQAIGVLLEWTPYATFQPPVRGRSSVWNRSRNRRLMFGSLEAARVIEYQMHSGICQYAVVTIGGPRPSPKFDSFEQAEAYVMSALADLPSES